MARQVQIKNGQFLTIADRPFASGGEGDLYKVPGVKDYENLVVKIYKPEKQTAERERKIDFLSKNPPNLDMQGGHSSVIWVDKLVYERGKFCGFTMPLARGEKLEMLCNSKLPRQLGYEWKKFDFAEPKSLELRQKICFNIAVAINQIHELDSYVLIDMKPENIMIQANGLVSVIDTDSVEVLQNGTTLFYAPVVSPEYTPPEYYRGVKPEKNGAPKSWDSFSMAVIFYRILCGIHPFVGSCHPPFDNCNSYELKIENGLFPNGKNRAKYKVIPKEHDNFRKLSHHVQRLFLQCFDDGHESPELRPTVEDWCKILVPDSALLPSFNNKFPEYVYCGKPAFAINIGTQLPAFPLPGLPKTSLLAELVSRFCTSSKKEQLRKLIKSRQSEFSSLLKRNKTFEERLKTLLESYNQQAQAILDGEKKEIGQLADAFKKRLLKPDETVKSRLEEERDMQQELYQKASAQIARYNNEISMLKERILQPEIKKLEAERTQSETLLAQIEREKNKDIATALKAPHKLANYIIATRVSEIFNVNIPQLVQALQSFGIFTAADFTDVNNSGAVKTINGSWYKIPGLGPKRAKLLDTWRKNTEIKENQTIIANISLRCEIAERSEKIRFAQYEHHWQITFAPLKEEYDQKKQVVEQQIRACHETYKTELEALLQNIKEQRESIVREANSAAVTIVQETLQLQASIAQSVKGQLKDNKDAHAKQLDSIKADYAAYETTVVSRYNDLLGLHTNFANAEN